MDKEEVWIDRRLQEAIGSNPTVTNAVRQRLKSFIKGQLRERHLRPEELSENARALITDMKAQAPGKKIYDEN
ncbi:MAG: hypothetical protein V3W18_13840 [candidate division Zixibacteria bacterium]